MEGLRLGMMSAFLLATVVVAMSCTKDIMNSTNQPELATKALKLKVGQLPQGADASVSRAAAEPPVVVYKDLGDGIRMEATIEREYPAATRADATTPLVSGAKVLAIVYSDPTGDKVIYSVQEANVSDESITIKVPVEFSYGILFITNNDTETVPNVGLSTGYYAPELNKKLSDVASWTYSTPTKDLLYFDTGEIGSTLSTINFKHVFSKMKVTVNGSKLGATINSFEAALQDTPDNATMASLNDWSFTSGATSTTDIPFSAASGTEEALTSGEGYFIPTGTESNHTIHFSEIYINGNTTKNVAGTNGVDFTFSKALVGNTSYSVTINLNRIYKPKTVLTVASSRGTYGYAGESGSSYEFLTSPTNFSLTGTVPIRSLTIDTSVKPGVNVSTNQALYNALTSSTPPDIVIFGVYCYWHAASTVTGTYNTSQAILDYVNKGGVVIILCEYGNTYNDGYREIVDNELTSIDTDGGAAGTVYLMDPTLTNNSNDDPIMSGKVGGLQYFPSVSGKYWGEDSSTSNTFKIESGSEGDFVVYSQSYASGNGNMKPTMIRYKKKNIIMVGDAGFLSGDSNGSASTTAQPFYLDYTTYAPASKKYAGYYAASDGSTVANTLVYNSSIFANMMAWAIYQAEYHGINTSK
jgi:hypothetical protein